MSYTPINWQTGDVITAAKLNKMDNGWSIESSTQQLFSETVTTALDPEYPDEPAWGDLTYQTLITANTLIVTFDSTEYVCQKVESEGTNVYGGWGEDGPNFTEYPFAILSESGIESTDNSICTPAGGTHTVSVSSSSTSIETSATFETVVNSIVDTSTMPMECVSGITTLADMGNAYNNGRIMFFRPFETSNVLKYITSFTDTTVTFIPADAQITVSITDGVFSVSHV